MLWGGIEILLVQSARPVVVRVGVLRQWPDSPWGRATNAYFQGVGEGETWTASG